MKRSGAFSREVAAPLASAAAFFLPLALYISTLAPTVTFEDSGEFIAAAHHLGVPHPSGYPLWCLLAHAFTWLPWASIAERVHLCSAVFGAGTAWLTYRVAVRLFSHRGPALWAALGLASSGVVWSQSVIAEVYTLNSFFTLLLVDLALRWRETRRARWLLAVAFALGLGLSNHPLLALAAPPLLAWLLAVDGRAVLRPAVVAAAVALLGLGLSVYLYLPIRASARPPVDVGHPATVSRALAHIGRKTYQVEAEQVRYGGRASDVVNHTGAAWSGTARALGGPLALLALIGVVTWPRQQRDVLAMTLGVCVFNTLVVNAMLTARFDAWWIFVHRVYYLPTHAMAALWLAAGAHTLLRAGTKSGRVGRIAALASLTGGLVISLVDSYPEAHRQGDLRARNYALDLLDSAPKGSGFLPLADEVVYPITYLKWVEGLRSDVHILSEDFGWRQETPSSVLVATPIGEALREDRSDLRDFVAVPQGLAYRLVPRALASSPNYRSFAPLAGPHRDIQLDWPSRDPFGDFIRSRYATYHIRLGAKALAFGRARSAWPEFARAEEINPGDAFVEVLLFEVYRHFGIRRQRWRPLLKAALEHFDEKVDPAIDRYYPIQRRDIVRYLESVALR